MSWPCTWWEETGRSMMWLIAECPDAHDTEVEVGMVEDWPEEGIHSPELAWPETCSTCGHVFDYAGKDEYERTLRRRYEWRQPSTGEVTLKLPAGALYDRSGYHSYRTGADGRSLVCVLPNDHHWFIDQRASNCTLPDDDEHYCWCRHGDPTQPETMHVDKACNTCQAGAGSIQSGDWHGFLHDGAVTT